jgi:ABC-type transporter Mla maintaining outer membrane lipid asymmetry ATPase subunit MlaF
MEPPANHGVVRPAAQLPNEQSPAAPVLELRDVAVASAETPKSPLLQGVNWTVAQGEFWVVGGLAGSGKSQLLQTAAGLQPPHAGTVRLFGRELAGLSASDQARTRQRVGFVFAEGGRLFNDLTVAQNVALPLCYHRDCQPEAVTDAVNSLLALTGLKPLAGRLAARIHRVWRQRVALARALALGPELLLLDNPTAGLDHRQAHWWVEFLVQLSAAGAGRQQVGELRHEAGGPTGFEGLASRPLTMVVATDELRPWLSVARQFAFLKGNQWRPLGGAAEVLSSAEPVLREMLAEPAAPG